MIDIHQLVAKYLPQDVKKPMTYREHIIDLANTKAPIHMILNDLYQIKVPEYSSSWKIHCPYGNEHKDGGRDTNCRVYSSSNTVYCFAQHFRMPPVYLYWRQYDHKNMFEAAQHIVADYELQPPDEDYRQRFARVSVPQVHQTFDLFDALQILLSENKKYKRHQFNPEILDLMATSRSETPFANPIQDTIDLYSKIEEVLNRLEPDV